MRGALWCLCFCEKVKEGRRAFFEKGWKEERAR